MAAAGVLRASIRERLPRDLPAGVAAILVNTLQHPPGSLNTDWFGTMLMEALLEWGSRGIDEVRPFAEAWLQFHLASGRVSPYSGAKSRSVDAAGVRITTYSGQFGLAFPCFQMARQYQDARARRVCLAVADIILNRTARDRYGMVNTDDNADFAIPDTCYFVAPPLLQAAALDPGKGWAYREQAVYQLRTYVDTFLAPETGWARTILLKEGLGKTYWTRASGWLLWALIGVLRHLPGDDPGFARFVNDLGVLAQGIARAQDASGGMHLFLDDAASPLETSGTAMFARGLHEAVRNRWLPASFGGVARRAWEFVARNVSDEGAVRGVYTSWAVPAERGIVKTETVATGWAPGMILSAACEITSL